MKSMILALFVSQTGGAVPASDIQAKIDQAAPNAVIELPEGTINGTLVIKQPLVLRGQGETKTVLQGNLDGSVVRILVPTKGEVKLERLEITNGGWNKRTVGTKHLTAPDLVGAGVYIKGAAHVVIDHVLLRRNYAPSAGGAIYLGPRDTLTIRDSQIRENNAQAHAGIWAHGHSLTIERTIIANNRAESCAGLGFFGKMLRLQDVSFVDNSIERHDPVHFVLATKEPESMSVAMDNVRLSATSRRAVSVEGPIKLRLRNTTWPTNQEMPLGTEILSD